MNTRLEHNTQEKLQPYNQHRKETDRVVRSNCQTKYYPVRVN